MRMSYTGKITFSKTRKELDEYVIPLCSRKQFNKAVRNELMHTVYGVIDGSWGGTALSWDEQFYRNLVKDDYAKFTEKGKRFYGD